MTPEIQTAFIGLATLIVTSFFGYLSMKLEKVHKIVNSQRTEMLEAIALLKGEVARLNVENTATPENGPGVTSQHGNVEVTPAV